MATISGISCKQIVKGAEEYDDHTYQYATSSHVTESRMDPALVVYPTSIEEIASILKHAKSQGVAVAIRTGGHQYSGASSTCAPNIQMDLKNALRGPNDRRIFVADGQTYVRTSVSWGLGEFNKFLREHKVFVPHGQCVDVHLGGHVQTGGFGQLGRSFGLLGDHVVSIEIVDHAGQVKEVTKKSDADLFGAILGGSPGNLGVITHFTIKVHRDEDHVGSKGLKAMYCYNPETLNRLLDILVEMSEDENFPRNYDFSITVLSAQNQLLDWLPGEEGIDEKMKEDHPELFGKDSMPFWPAMILAGAQWVPFSKDDVCDMSWFERIREGSLLDLPVRTKPMSELTGQWIFTNVREFNHPYIKAAHFTNSKTLSADGWAKWATKRIDGIVKPLKHKCFVLAQFQCFGGKNSQFYTNRDNGTSYSWRDSTVCSVMDCFYAPGYKQTAEDWVRVNNQEGVGANGKFSKDDRRMLWGSFGDFDLDKCWNHYYDSREKYDNLRKIRRQADPDGTFTPNTFCVARE
ncbi:putative FAD-linked oxidoreductase [Xylogone sp. PMI_703]|nr:putative FAD-linked oxidoreductase [Xylogone sp. PMI_703]